MDVTKTLKIPIHYGTTKHKTDILERLTARISFCICLISELVEKAVMADFDGFELDRPTVRKLVKCSDVVERTGMSAGFVDQCIDKVVWEWKSYKTHHHKWESSLDSFLKTFDKTEDPEVRLENLLKREPEPPDFTGNKVPCRIDVRTGKVWFSESSSFSPLWMNISTLKKQKTIDVPLNPCKYHLKWLKKSEIRDFELVKFEGKFFANVSIRYTVEDREPSSIGGLDQGLNITGAIVLLPNPEDKCQIPVERIVTDEKRREVVFKYEEIRASLQRAGNLRKLKKLRHKIHNVAVDYDRHLAIKIADETEGSYLAIGDARFRQTQFRGNGMPTLRKDICKWAYGRQRTLIALKRAERGDTTVLKDEYMTSKIHHECGSRYTVRKYAVGQDGMKFSYLICYNCGAKIDADINAAYNIALRCRDDRLKAQMKGSKKPLSVQNGYPSIY